MTTSERSIRNKYASQYREKSQQNRIASPIRDLAIMVRDCKEELVQSGMPDEALKILNLTIGDVEPRHFFVDGNPSIAKNLGLDPSGDTQKQIREKIVELRSLAWTRGIEPRLGYQPEALGLPLLRKKYAEYVSSFGLGYTSDETALTFGSLHGIESLLQTLYVEHDKKVTMIAPTPGFSVIHTQAKRLGVEVVPLSTSPETGYCPTSQDLAKTLATSSNDVTILYLTPMNNPTSTVYDEKILSSAVDTFKTLRPNGIILVDLAYMEMIPKHQAKQLLNVFEQSNMLDQTVLSISMSKVFSYPRLRSAAILTKNKEIIAGMKSTAQVNYASIAGPIELEATAIWDHVTPEARQEYFTLLKQRQAKLLQILAPFINTNLTFTDVPMYVYAQLKPEYDFLDLFVEKGICGVPGEVFGDDPNNRMIRFSTGIEPLK